jgi:transposase
LRHVAFDARPVDQRRPQRRPVDVEFRKAAFGRELGFSVRIGRRRFDRIGHHYVGRRSALGADRGKKDETPGARAPRGAGEADRRRGIDDAVVVLGNARHRVSEPGRVDDSIHAFECRRHVSRPGETADGGAMLRYLPKYSPALNPTEMPFSKLRAYLRKAAERTIPRLRRRTGRFARTLTTREASNYFRHAGYA